MGTSAGNLAPAKQRLYEQLVDALHALFGVHPGYRPVHAKDVVCEGTFHPAATAASVSRAPHLQSAPVPIMVRFSDFAGFPTVPDGDPLASPRGMAMKFHLPGQIDTDLVAQSYDGFPTRTAEEFLEFVPALAARRHAAGPGARTGRPARCRIGPALLPTPASST
jgi:catalase